ncbi:outer membrane efflux domain protein [Orientia chuto str. Dubai]|uniref:Outer membrane efflux domain protein n=1 Tax=Orientia chuto str. Dubai TaxID=1359168 RepID=A0A0F3MNC1_9RICK|nr:TolC family protein [Candidatus Orientia mediorientalis]KJV57235.1 outer membrane efflux domain protein [Orientia chuto str. Dubai]
MLISFKKTILAIYYLILLTYSFSCCAIDINTALSNAYQSSIKFKLLQDKFFQQANQHLKIYANFLPEAHTSISSGKRYHHNGNNNWSSSGNWLPNKHATNNLSNVELSISQNLFNGGQDLIRLKINKQEA